MNNWWFYSRSLAIFSLVGYWPVAMYLLFIGSGMLLTFAPLANPSAEYGEAVSRRYLLEALVSLLAPVTLVVLAHGLCFQTRSWRKRGWVFYASWVMIAFVMAFTLSAALGGASMAVVEGVAGSVAARYLNYLASALFVTAVAHALIVPWVLLSVFLLKRLARPGLLWPQ